MPSLLDVRGEGEPERLALTLDERRLLAIEAALGSLAPDETYDDELTLEVLKTLASLASFAETKAVAEDAWPVLARIVERGSRWLEARPGLMPALGPLWTRDDLAAFELDLAEWERTAIGDDERRMLEGFLRCAEQERFADEAAAALASSSIARARALIERDARTARRPR